MAVLLRYSDHVADVVHRYQRGHLGDEVDPALAGDIVDDATRVGDDVIVDAGQLLGSEGRRHQPADLGVPRGIHRDEALGGVEEFPGDRLERDAFSGQEIAGAAGDLHQVGVPDHGPEALVVGIFEHAVLHRLMPGDGPVRPQLGEYLLTVLGGPRPELHR